MKLLSDYTDVSITTIHKGPGYVLELVTKRPLTDEEILDRQRDQRLSDFEKRMNDFEKAFWKAFLFLLAAIIIVQYIKWD